jgi:hypothetical protein
MDSKPAASKLKAMLDYLKEIPIWLLVVAVLVLPTLCYFAYCMFKGKSFLDSINEGIDKVIH